MQFDNDQEWIMWWIEDEEQLLAEATWIRENSLNTFIDSQVEVVPDNGLQVYTSEPAWVV